ncbi:hypothetical protein AFV9_gp65 [Betalipothrixvirus uzonense]|uniref:Uncharacterized protein n=1 Tax=Betalipothrixvirus uzonense TaxID=512792 RepID=B2CRP2_9VIRU|nr:hypothetical protein AFV9_gp65 [Acidianus filamentous virus 9]ACB37299.1 hypothetical protein [Acidianus filamentous virus 9]
MRFTHEDRFLIGLLYIFGLAYYFVTCYHVNFILGMGVLLSLSIWIIYELVVDLYFCHNFNATFISVFVGFYGMTSLVYALCSFFTNIFADVALLFSVIFSIYINILSFRSHKC